MFWVKNKRIIYFIHLHFVERERERTRERGRNFVAYCLTQLAMLNISLIEMLIASSVF